MLTFTVPGIPCPQNDAWRIIKVRLRGRGNEGKSKMTMELTPRARAYKLQIAIAAQKAGPKIAVGRVHVDMDIYFPDRSFDADGPVKLILDGLQGQRLNAKSPVIGGCISNDKQVASYHAEQFYDPEKPRTEVRVRHKTPVVRAVAGVVEGATYLRDDGRRVVVQSIAKWTAEDMVVVREQHLLPYRRLPVCIPVKQFLIAYALLPPACDCGIMSNRPQNHAAGCPRRDECPNGSRWGHGRYVTLTTQGEMLCMLCGTGSAGSGIGQAPR